MAPITEQNTSSPNNPNKLLMIPHPKLSKPIQAYHKLLLQIHPIFIIYLIDAEIGFMTHYDEISGLLAQLAQGS